MPFLQDKINKIMAYFDTEDLEQEAYDTVPEATMSAPHHVPEQPRQTIRKEDGVSPMVNPTQMASISQDGAHETYTRSHHASAEMAKIDIKFPKKPDEAREIVKLLLQNVSVLIDFQFMTDSQARRCIDYLDGARFVVEGNLKKISSTMFLLTPANVKVNIDDIGLRSGTHETSANFDYDMKRS